MIPSYYSAMLECNLGIILACGPAIRQWWAYRSRTHTSLPTKHRQYPNEDFVKMRYRINLRDIFWYRKAHSVGNRVLDATPIFKSRSPPPDASSSNQKGSSQVSNSVLDVWEKRIKRIFGSDRSRKVTRVPSGTSPIAVKSFHSQYDRVSVFPHQRPPSIVPLCLLRSGISVKRLNQLTRLQKSFPPVADGACSRPNPRVAVAALTGRPFCSLQVELV